MARSKPHTNFYINYGPVTPTGNADALIPIFIAPRYGLHGSAYGDGKLETVYSGATISAAWPDRDANSVVDLAAAEVVFDNPTVAIGNASNAPITSVTASASVSNFYNSVTFSGAVAGSGSILFGGYQLRPGDKIELTSGTDSVVYGVNNVIVTGGTATPDVTSANIGSGITGTASATSSYDNETKLVYAIYPTSAGASSMATRVVNIAGDPGFPPQSSIDFTSGSAVTIGDMGLAVTFTGDDFTAVGTSGVFLASLTPPSETAYNTAVLDNSVESAYRTGATARIYTNNIVSGAAKVDAHYVNVAADSVSISSGAKVAYNNNNYEVVECSDIYTDYRALLQDDVGEVTTGARSDIATWAGKINPDNPLGMCYGAAANAGTPDFFLLPVAEDTDEAYIEALQIAGKLEAAYALFPLRQTPAVIAAAKNVVAKYSAPSIAQLKRLWLYSQDEQMSEIKLVEADTPMASITDDGVLNLEGGALFTGSAVKSGTTVVLHSVYNPTTQETTDITVTIEEIIDVDSAKVTPIVGVAVPAVASFYNKLTPSKYAEEIAGSAAAQNNVRINYVYAEENTVNGYSFEDARYIVPVLMAMRSAMAPHAPLTDVVIPGVSIGAAVGFTELDYDTMNNAGVWVCYRNNNGENVTLHAVTTGGEGTIAEEDSAVSNGDNIVRFVRNQLSWLKGNCNVSELLIEKVEVDCIDAISRIQARDYGPLIGRQIIEVNGIEVKQDPNNSAGLIGTFDLDLPDVYLDGSFTFNLI